MRRHETDLAEVCSRLNAHGAKYVSSARQPCRCGDPEAARAATVFEVEGVRIPTASLDHLIASKRTGRLQDAADIEVLEEIKRIRGDAGERDWVRAWARAAESSS